MSTQELAFETDNPDAFAAALSAMIPIFFVPLNGTACRIVEPRNACGSASPSDAVAWHMDRHFPGGLDEWRKQTGAEGLYFHICVLEEPWHDAGMPCATSAQAVEETLRRIRQTNIEQFYAHCGGQQGPFYRGSGGVRPGYRFHMSSVHGAYLTISLCHIYLSK